MGVILEKNQTGDYAVLWRQAYEWQLPAIIIVTVAEYWEKSPDLVLNLCVLTPLGG